MRWSARELEAGSWKLEAGFSPLAAVFKEQ
jgi:hypothetical protein